MLQANSNLLGRLVAANESSAPRSATCPHCGASVSLRKGSLYQPYYAHNRGEGTEECEEFYGGAYADLYFPPSVHPPNLRRRPPRAEGLLRTGGLFISSGRTGKPSLTAQLPSTPPGETWEGKILVTSPEGETSISFQDIAHAEFLRVCVCTEPLDVRTTGNVPDSYLERLRESSFRLNDTRNVFRWSPAAGRQVSPNSPLFWSERYWLLKNNNLPEPKLSAITESIQQRLSINPNWTLFEIQLPPSGMITDPSLRQAIVSWVGHAIVEAAPRLILQSNAVHHLDRDGRFVIPSECEQFELIRSHDYEVDAMMADGYALEVFQKDAQTVSVSDLRDGIISIYFDDQLSLEVVREDCPLFEPTSIGLNWDGRIREVFEGRIVLDEWNSKRHVTPPVIYLDNDALLPIVNCNGEIGISVDEMNESLHATELPFYFGVGPFGTFSREAIRRLPTAIPANPSVDALVKYLLSIAVSDGTVRLTLTARQKEYLGDQTVSRLGFASWPREFQANVSNLKLHLDKMEHAK